MSNQIEQVGPLSEDELIDWLKVKPRTFGWDAVVVYDRAKTNTILRQKYNRDYKKEGGFSIPKSRVTLIEGRHWEYLYGQYLDAPLLTFENSTLSHSMATLTMQVMGGTQLTVEQDGGSPKRVTKVELHDPLQGPKLIAGINLAKADGVVTDGGKAQFDLSQGVDFKLTFGSTAFEQTEGGNFYKELFDKLPIPKKVFVLNEFGDFDSNDLLQPHEFRVRGMPAPGAAVRGAENYGDGAVLVFISTRGGEVGSIPDSAFEWVYPIPAGRSSTLLMSHKLLMEHMLFGGLKRAELPGEFGVVASDDRNGVIEIHGINGAFNVGFTSLIEPPFSHFTLELDVSFSTFNDGETGLRMYLDGDGLVYEWGVDFSRPDKCRVLTMTPDGITNYDLDWKVMRRMRFAAYSEGAVSVEWIGPPEFIDDTTVVREAISPEYEKYIPTIIGIIRRRALEQMGEVFDRAAVSAVQIDDFRLHGLLFAGGDEVVSVNSVHAAADLALFGDLTPSLTKFTLAPLEEVIAAGSKVTFTSIPPVSNLTWSVEAIDGFEKTPGTVDAKGIYTAPAGTALEGAYSMARVTATDGKHSSSALIRVVARTVVVNPLVGLSSTSAGKMRMSGGTVDRGSLDWTIKSATGATLVLQPPESSGVFDDNDRFYVPGKGSSGKPFSVDEITATNPRTKASHTSYVVVAEKPLMGKVSVAEDAGLPEGKVQLQLDGGMGVIPDATWTVLAGGGSINADGVYSVDQNSLHHFAVISGSFSLPPYAEFNDYIILPLPLIDLEELQRVLA